jgi:hypothetical protein
MHLWGVLLQLLICIILLTVTYGIAALYASITHAIIWVVVLASGDIPALRTLAPRMVTVGQVTAGIAIALTLFQWYRCNGAIDCASSAFRYGFEDAMYVTLLVSDGVFHYNGGDTGRPPKERLL